MANNNINEETYHLVEKTPRQCIAEICNLSTRSVRRILGNPKLKDKHGVREEMSLYIENTQKHISKRRKVRKQSGLRR